MLIVILYKKFLSSLHSDGGYAMIGDASSLKYLALQNCDLTLLDQKFDTKFFGFALPKQNSLEFREKISSAFINLGLRGKLKALQEKWWPHNS